jgi:micrococcal nuclease
MYEYKARVKRVVDGDTLDLEVDLGFTVKVDIRVRLYGIDTPEIHGVKKESKEYKRGKVALEAVKDFLEFTEEHGAPVLISSHDGDSIGQGKYGRWLVEVWAPGMEQRLGEWVHVDKGPSLNDYLVANGYAVEKDY